MNLRNYFCLSFLVLVVSILVIFTAMNYFETKNEIIKKNKELENSIEKSIINNIETVNSSYKMLGEVYDDRLKEILFKIKNEYDKKNGLDDLNLSRIKKALDMDIDLYVINRKGVIVATTYPTDLGLDLSKYTGFFENLMDIFKRNKFVTDSLTPETQTGKLRKYAYLPSDDRKYIFEVGLESSNFKRYLNHINYFKLANKITNDLRYVSDIKIFRASNAASNVTIFGKPERQIPQGTKNIIANMFRNDINEKAVRKDGYKINYVLVKLRTEDIPSDMSKVVEITYKKHLMNESLMANLFSHIVLSFIAILFSIILVYYLSKRLT